MKFKTCEQTTKPQTNYSCCLWFRLLMPYWLSLRNTKTFHEYFWCSRFCEFHSNSYICYIGFVFHNTQWTFLLDQFARCYCEQTTKPQTNYSCCLWFRLLMPYWLSLRNTKTFHEYFWCSRFCEFHSKRWLVKPQVAQAGNMSIGEHRHCCVTFKI